MAVLLDLPPELLNSVLCLVDVRDVCHCYQACKRLRDIVLATPFLQYHMGLAAAGLVDGPEECRLSLMERSQLLRRRHKAWRTLEPTLIVQTENPQRVQRERPTALEMRALQIDLEIDDMQHGLLGVDVESDMLDWRNDPAQDLLVILNETEIGGGLEPSFVRLHFRTWSSRGSEDHPEANQAWIDFSVDGEEYDGMSFHLMGRFIALVVRTGENTQHVFVVEWKTHLILLSIVVQEAEQRDVTDIQILDECTVAVATPESLCLYDIRGGAHAPLVILHLPMRLYTSCSLSCNQQMGSLKENIPFTTAPYTGDRIFVVHQRPHVAETDSRGFFYMMLVNSLLRLFRDADRANAGMRVLQWNEWGPDNTRVLSNRATLRVDRLVSGTRILWPTFDAVSDLNILRYEILDFSRVPSARAGVARSETRRSLASDFALHEEESTTDAFHDGEQLIPAVQSRLAYSSATLSFDEDEATVSFESFLDSAMKGWYPVELHEDRLIRVVQRGATELGEVYVL